MLIDAMLSKKIAQGTSYITLMNIIDTTIAFIFYTAISRILLPNEVGQVSLLFLIINVFNTLTLLALNNAMIKYVSEYVGMKRMDMASLAFRKATNVLTMISIPSFAISIIIIPMLKGILEIDSWSLLFAFTIALILNYTNLIGGVLYGLTLFDKVAIQNIIFYSMSRVSAVILAIALNVKGIALGLTIGAFVCLIYSIMALKGRLPYPNGDFLIRRLFSYSLPLYTNNIIALTQGWMDIVVLYTISSSLSVIGIYYLVVSSTLILSILWNPLTSTLFPTMSLRKAESSDEGVKQILEFSTRIIFLIVLPVSFALAVTSKTALTLVYGINYAEGSLAFSIITSTMIIPALSSLYTITLQAVGETKPIMVAGIASIITDVIVLFIAVPTLSGVGAAIARVFMALSTFVVTYKYVSKSLHIKLQIPWRILAFSIASIAPLIAIEQLSMISLAKGIIEFFAFIITVIICIKIMKPINDQDKQILKMALPTKLKFIIKFI